MERVSDMKDELAIISKSRTAFLRKRHVGRSMMMETLLLPNNFLSKAEGLFMKDDEFLIDDGITVLKVSIVDIQKRLYLDAERCGIKDI